MSSKSGRIGQAIEWIGRADTIHSVIQAEFVRTLLLPTVTAVATGASGVLGGIPLMWVIMATAIAFAAAAVGLFASSFYIERKNPAHKLQIMRTMFNYDLVPIQPPNRKQNRAAKSKGGRQKGAINLAWREVFQAMINSGHANSVAEIHGFAKAKGIEIQIRSAQMRVRDLVRQGHLTLDDGGYWVPPSTIKRFNLMVGGGPA